MRVRETPRVGSNVQVSDITHRVAITEIEARGIAVPQLIEKLIDGAAAEFKAYYEYTILRLHLTGHMDYTDAFDEARFEAVAHFESITLRISELRGHMPSDVCHVADRARWPIASLPELSDGARQQVERDLTAKQVVEYVLGSVRCAIRMWWEVCDVTSAKDFRTHEMALRILNDKIVREARLIELLSGERDARVRSAEPER
jgi:ferritin-like protein